MALSLEQLSSIMPNAAKAGRAVAFLGPLNETLDSYDIVEPLEIAAFLAHAAHETGELRWMREVWGPTDAQRRYEGRADLGNTEPGDGFRFRGAGIFQYTGRANFKKAGFWLGEDFESNPELLATPRYACLSAGVYWTKLRDCATPARAGDFKKTTKLINGGYNGIADRMKYYEKAKQVLVNQSIEEKAMPLPAIVLAAAQAAIPALIQAAPALFDIFKTKNPEKAAKQEAVLETVVNIAKAATNKPTVEEAVQELQVNDESRMAFNQAVKENFLDLVETAKAFHEQDEASREAAMKRVVSLPGAESLMPKVLAGQFVITAVVIMGAMISAGIIAWRQDGNLPDWMVGMMNALVVVVALEWRSIVHFFVGTSSSSAAKNAIIEQMADKRQ